MMCSMRRAAPVLLGAALFILGCTMGASAMAANQTTLPEPISHILAEWIVGNVIAVLGSMLAAIKGTQMWLKAHVAGSLFAHNADEKAHFAASKHNHEPLQAQLAENHEVLVALLTKIDAIHATMNSAKTDLDAQEKRLRDIEQGFATMHAEHEIIHAAQLARAKAKRATDAPGFEPPADRESGR